MSKKNGGSAVQTRARRARPRRPAPAAKETSVSVPRATSAHDDDDILLSGGGLRGAGFGRCGGRVLSTRIEQTLCDKLSRIGVTHSHSPRHFEVRIDDNALAAYAPMIVLRGRGREGKTVVIEAATERDPLTLGKIEAFRRKLGIEFYVIFVAPEELLDEIPVTVYDESCATTDLDTLVSRLAD
jgi:hypothetical protein